MVYEVRCDNCGDLLEFGGNNPEESNVAPHSRLPENAVEFDDKVYCEKCVEKFVKFGIGDVEKRIELIEDQMEKVRDELGIEKHQEI